MCYLFVLFRSIRNNIFKSAIVKFVVFCISRTLRVIRQTKMDSNKSSNLTSTTTITFKADENQCLETNKAKHVTVIGSCIGKHDHGSSKLKLKNIVDYKWEVKNYNGRLIAVHLDGRHIAYAIKVSSGSAGMVRVFDSSNGHRALIKGMSSEVLDLQFAHMKSTIMLGCIEQTALHVHKIESLPNEIVCTLLIKIEDPIPGHVPLYDKVKWCPFVPEGDDDADENVAQQQLVWFRKNIYQCYSIRSVIDAYGIGTHKNVTEGSLKQEESSAITDATFSPDGTALSVSCENGVIRFYQIYFHTNEQNPRCLHKWIPHYGKSISSVFFLDDYTTPNPEKSLWKYAITTSDNNSELKVWSCSTWECLQTIKFQSPNVDSELIFKAEIDHKSSYLVLSDIKNRSLYVLQIQKPSHYTTDTKELLNTSGSELEKSNTNRSLLNTYIKSISEFPLSSPILSFGIADAAVRRYKCNYNDNYLLDEMDDYDEDTNSLYCVVIRMYLVQPKSVQECRVLYQPSVSLDSDIRSTISGSYNHSSNDQSLSDRILENTNDRLDKSGIENTINVTSPRLLIADNSSMPLQPKSTPINLMTPDSFHSPGKKTPEGVSNEVLSTIRMLAKVQSPPDAKKKAENVNLLNMVNNKSLEEHEIKIRQSVELPKIDNQDKEKTVNLPTVNNKTDWPKVPQVPVISSMSNSNAFNNVNSNTPFNDLTYKLDQVLEFMQTQACQISELKNSIEIKNNSDENELKTFSKSIEFNVTKMIEEYLVRYEREHKKKLESFISERDKQNRELRDGIIQSVTQLVNDRSQVLMNEMTRHILPIIMSHLDKIKAQIQSDVAQKLTSCDQIMKDSIMKACASKANMEIFGNSVATGIQSGLQRTYTETLKTTIIPAFEKTSVELFRQIQNAFLQGTKSYCKQFDGYMSQYQPMHEEVMSLLTAVPDQLKSINNTSNHINQIQTEFTKDLKSLQMNLLKSLTESIKKEIQKGFESQTASINESVLSVVHSQAHTPAPTFHDVQEQIKSHLAQGHVNSAFHNALLANDLSLVEYVLEKADYKQVFYPCSLEQAVLLSLIQQISADMQSHNDLKQKYLTDAVVSLDIHDETVTEHGPKILYELYQQCQNYISSNPNSQLVGGIRVLMMAVQGLGLKIF